MHEPTRPARIGLATPGTRLAIGSARPRVARNVLTVALLATLLVSFLTGCGTTPAAEGDDEIALEVVRGAVESHATVSEADTIRIRHLDGAVVEGEVVVKVRGRRVDAVTFYLDDRQRSGAPWSEDTEEPFLVTIDTTDLDDGEHWLTAEIASGRRTRIVEAAFVVDNVPDVPTPEQPTPEEPAPEEPAPEEPAPEEPAPEEPVVDPAPRPEPTPSPSPSLDGTVFVSPSGSDANDGRSVERPFRTLAKAAASVAPGDVVMLRGGTYSIDVTFAVSGTSSAPITWTSYPGEHAILDGSGQTPVTSTHRMRVYASWNRFLDFEVRNSPLEGIFVMNAHDNLFRGLVVHGNHYSGILNYQSDRNVYEDLVLYDNYDEFNPYGRQGDDADGIGISTGDRNVVRRVFAFDNSDDGIDTWKSTNTLVEDSIAYRNGRGAYGNGNGIKAGGASQWVGTVVRNSIAFGNRASGFDYNSGLGVRFEGNTAYMNGTFDFAAGEGTVLRNNLAFGGRIGMWTVDDRFNSWNVGIGDPRFVSTDPTSGNFLSLRSDSPAIDAGTDVGSDFLGSAPDLGAVGDGVSFFARFGVEGVPVY